jgi:hypothetical protein
MFAKTDVYLKTFAPGPPTTTPPPEDATASSLAPTRFIQVFGEGAEGLLQDVVDGDPEDWTPDQQMLALKVLSGELDLKDLGGEERSVLDGITDLLASPRAPKPKTPATIQRPSHYSTQAEMENFDQEYQPPPARQDWPSGDLPEGDQG